MKILFTICGRSGSKGFKNKNLKSLDGVPLVYYSLAAIKLYKDAHPSDEIAVALNTDSKELICKVKNQNMVMNVIYVDREKKLAGDRVAKVDVIKDTYNKVGGEFEVVVDLDITSPLRRVADIENILDIYAADNLCDLVFSAVKARRNPYFNMVEGKTDGFYGTVCRSGFTARQQAPTVYEMNASIYAYRPVFLQSGINRPITDYRCGISAMPDYLVLDIDSEEDLLMLELLYSYFVKADRALGDIREACRTAVCWE